MCAIAGIVNYAVAGRMLRERADVMRACLRHRGPDAQATLVLDHAVLAHARLSLIDIEGGAQPLRSADGRFVIVYNGEVYNHAELRAELSRDWAFASCCDTEVVLAAYCVWGERCLSRLNGMFSFFIWDERERSGFAARDLLGIKPFIFSYRNGEFVFASEAKAILAQQGGPARLNHEAFLEYLVAPYFSGVEAPLFEGLAYLPAGHCLRLDEQGLRIHAWGDYELDAGVEAPEELAEAMSKGLRAAVGRALVSDVPVASYLSGGLDSTLITALAHVQSETVLKGYTVCFTGHADYDYAQSLMVRSDDTPHACNAAREIGVEQVLVEVPQAAIAGALRELAQTNDAIPAWEQEIAQHFLAKAVAGDFKAVLVGDAADELHFGYPFLLDARATKSPRGIIERFGLPPLRDHVAHAPVAYFEVKYKMLATKAGHRWDSPEACARASAYLVIKRWLPRLLHNGDIHCMRHALEARVPFADTELLALAARVSPRLGYRNRTEKWFLRECARGLMPEQARVRAKSALPKDQRSSTLYRSLLPEVMKNAGEFLEYFFEPAWLRRLGEPGGELDEQGRAQLFRVLAVGYWSQAYNVEPV